MHTGKINVDLFQRLVIIKNALSIFPKLGHCDGNVSMLSLQDKENVWGRYLMPGGVRVWCDIILIRHLSRLVGFWLISSLRSVCTCMTESTFNQKIIDNIFGSRPSMCTHFISLISESQLKWGNFSNKNGNTSLKLCGFPTSRLDS